MNKAWAGLTAFIGLLTWSPVHAGTARTIEADVIISSDHSKTFTVDSTEIKANDNAGSITKGKVVYIKSNGNVDLADVDTVNDVAIGLVYDASIASAASGKILFETGKTLDGFSSLTPGAKYYLGDDGAITASVPTNSGERQVRVGYAISATVLKLDPDYEFLIQ